MENITKPHTPIRGWVRVLLIQLPYMIFVGIFTIVSYKILGLDIKNRQIQETPFQYMVINLFTLLGSIGVIGFFRHFIDKENFQSIGFYPKGFQQETMIGLILGFLIMAAGFVSLILFHEIQWKGINPDPVSFVYSLCFFIFVGISEELFMRGYILNNLMKSMNRWSALLVSSVLFSLMHIFNADFSWISFWNILLAGILLGLPYIYTKSLWLPVALHFSWNFFQGTIFGFNVSGHVTYSLINQTRTVDNLWNGGAFGFEGSILSIVFQVIAIGGLWWYYEKKSKNASSATEPSIIPEL